jgi:hypothetical protein
MVSNLSSWVRHPGLHAETAQCLNRPVCGQCESGVAMRGHYGVQARLCALVSAGGGAATPNS